VDIIKTVTIRCSADTQSFKINVKPFIWSDIYNGQRYCAFRFRDVTAEVKGNPDLKPAGVVLMCEKEKSPSLSIKESK
jgi:hypothetical protein